MVTRKDVAKAAYVSTATVSNVVNNKPGVSDDLRERVWKVIEELGYRPNYIARSLKTRQTNQIALVSDVVTNPYFSEVTRGLEDAAFECGYMVAKLNVNKARKDKAYVDELIQRQFDGVIINTSKISNDDINKLAKYNIPVICAGKRNEEEQLDVRVCVQAVNVQSGVRELLEYVLSQGHTKIGFINSEREKKELRLPSARVRAYNSVLNDHNIPIREEYLFLNENTLETAFENTITMLSLDDPPTAIFAGNDYLAIAVYSAINKMGYRIPDDISVVGVDNMAMSQYSIPPLTTLYVPNYEMGRKYMDVLKSKMNGEQIGDQFSPTELIIRESVKKIKN